MHLKCNACDEVEDYIIINKIEKHTYCFYIIRLFILFNLREIKHRLTALKAVA